MNPPRSKVCPVLGVVVSITLTAAIGACGAPANSGEQDSAPSVTSITDNAPSYDSDPTVESEAKRRSDGLVEHTSRFIYETLPATVQ